MGGFQGLELFALSFPPGQSARLVFCTWGVKVVLKEEAEPESLLRFLLEPPREFFSLLKWMLAFLGGGKEESPGVEAEETWPDMGWEERTLGTFLRKEDWPGGVKPEFPRLFSQLFSGSRRSWLDFWKEKERRPFSYHFSVERGGLKRAETTLSLFRGGDLVTVVGSGAGHRDLEVLSALLSCFFFVLGRLLREVVTLLVCLKRLGLIIFF